MKTAICFIFIASLMGLPLAAQAVLRAQPNRVDFGTCDRGVEKSFSVQISNLGKEPLVLGRPTANCLCAELSIDTPTIAPAGTAKLTVTLDTKPLDGPVKKSIAIPWTGKDKSKGELRIPLEGVVVSQWRVEPPVWSFGDVDPGQSLIKTFRISRRAGAKVKLRVEDPRLQLKETADGWELRFKERAPRSAGPWISTVAVLADDPLKQAQLIQIAAAVRGDLILRPKMLRFGRVRKGKALQRGFQIVSRSQTPFRIVGVKAPALFDTPKHGTNDAVSQTVFLVIAKDAPVGVHAGKITVQVDRKKNAFLELDFRLRLEPAR